MLQNQFPPPKQRIKTLESHHKHLTSEQTRKIDRENQLLFLRILDISTKPKRSCSTTLASTPVKTTLNLKNRKDFQEKIAFENQRIYERIKQQTSHYTKSKSKSRVNTSFIPQRKPPLADCLYTGIVKQKQEEYRVQILVEGDLFKILASTQEQSYTRVLEMTKYDGYQLIQRFDNQISKLVANLNIGERITIKGVELVEGHGNF